jgi:YggT family protein
MIALLSLLLSLFSLTLFVRAVLSYFPHKEGTLASINDFTVTVTEPVVAPVRRVVPPVGGFDVSLIVVFIGIYLIRVIFLRA